jgi:phosphodiesterase/alkaline phosphatase D-like protein
MTNVTVSARARQQVSYRLALSTSRTMSSPVYGSSQTPANGVVKLTCSGLTANTTYFYCVEAAGVLDTSLVGTFKTPATGAQTFKMAFASCAVNNSSRVVFDSIAAENPLFFVHLGDMFYDDIGSNTPRLFRQALDRTLLSDRQGRLLRNVPTIYMYDDHDYGPNDSNGSSASRPAAVANYKERVPHPPLVETGATDANYFSFEIGRVRFIVTDLRSMKSPQANADNASKTMMGAAQKTWFKSQLSSASGKIICWLCTTPFITNATGGADHWGGYTTERTEIADHIKANCAGKVMVLTGDTHALAIDDGTNGDFATGLGGAVKEFTASPLDQSSGTWPATYTSGYFTNNGQYGVVEFVDTGGSTITVNWTGKRDTGATLTTLSFNMTP